MKKETEKEKLLELYRNGRINDTEYVQRLNKIIEKYDKKEKTKQ